MKIKGPIVTLGAVAALGIGIWLVNVGKESESLPTKPATPVVISAPAAAPAPSTPSTPAAAPFGAQEDFVATIPTKNGDLALEIRVTGDKARAYACDNKGIETWLSGSATAGVLKLASTDGAGNLEGRQQGYNVVGNLRIGDKDWDFTARPGASSVF